jgi:hypothetical protein
LRLADQDWSAWYRLFSAGRFLYDAASDVVFRESLRQGVAEAVKNAAFGAARS